MSTPKWKLELSSSPTKSARGSSKLPRTACCRSKGLSGHGYGALAVRRPAVASLPAPAGSTSATAAQRRARNAQRMARQVSRTRRTLLGGEGSSRIALLPARGRRWGAADAQVRDAPPDARNRDARARAGRPEVGPHGRRAPAADAGVGPPRALSRTAWAQDRKSVV